MPPRKRTRPTQLVSPLPERQEYEPDGWPPGFTYDPVRRLVVERGPDGSWRSAVPDEQSPLMAPWVDLRRRLSLEEARASRMR